MDVIESFTVIICFCTIWTAEGFLYFFSWCLGRESCTVRLRLLITKSSKMSSCTNTIFVGISFLALVHYNHKQILFLYNVITVLSLFSNKSYYHQSHQFKIKVWIIRKFMFYLLTCASHFVVLIICYNLARFLAISLIFSLLTFLRSLIGQLKVDNEIWLVEMFRKPIV